MVVSSASASLVSLWGQMHGHAVTVCRACAMQGIEKANVSTHQPAWCRSPPAAAAPLPFPTSWAGAIPALHVQLLAHQSSASCAPMALASPMVAMTSMNVRKILTFVAMEPVRISLELTAVSATKGMRLTLLGRAVLMWTSAPWTRLSAMAVSV